MNMKDPTRAEMLTFLEKNFPDPDYGTFDREEAIYWFCDDWHAGKWSNTYSALCNSPYKPGPITTGPETHELVEALEKEYADD